MSYRLVTLATFDTLPQAHIALNALRDAGIWAELHDEDVVSSLWTVTNAVSGIKLTIRDKDIQRAMEVVGPLVGVALPGDTPVSEEELTRQALAEVPEEAPPSDPPSVITTPATSDEPQTELIDRDKLAWRTFWIAWFGVVFWPFAFFALYLFLQAAFGTGTLSRLGRIRLIATAGVLGLSLMSAYLMMPMCCGVFLR